MSNALSVRRVKIQTINEDGSPDGPPTYGIIAADDHNQIYQDTWMDLETLNDAIDNAKSILDAIDPQGIEFPGADDKKIGYDNFYGKNWQQDF